MLANFAATVLPCMWKLQCTLENWKKILYCITRNAEVIKLLSQEQERCEQIYIHEHQSSSYNFNSLC